MRLGDDDRRAVDLLLDRSPSSRGNGNGGDVDKGGAGTSAAPEVWERRIHSVERLFQVLGYLPAADPPGDLAGRTIQRVEQAGNYRPGTGASSSTLGSSPPMA